MVSAARVSAIRRVLAQRIPSVTLILDAPYDPHNGAAVLRSCDAFGVTEMHVVTTHHAFLASKIVARGAERWVDVTEHRSAQSAISNLRARGFELVLTSPEGELVPEDLAHIGRLALIVGNEHAGVGDELARSAGRSVRIPMVGFVESLNLSVSAAILLRAATRGRPTDLAPEAWSRYYAQALYRSVKRADAILCAMQPT
jgi:tRNA (guanosine-2'-O-)-methyltransferase